MTRRILRFLEKVTVKDREGKQTHQRTDSAAGLGDLKRHHRKVNNISLKQNRNAEKGRIWLAIFDANSCRGKVI